MKPLSRCRARVVRYFFDNLVRLALLVLSTLAAVSQPEATYAAPVGVRGWMNGSTAFSTPEAACRDQWQDAGMDNGYSRFIGADPGDNWISQKCDWTSYIHYCPQETGGGVFNCDTLLPAGVSFFCESGYTREFPFRCVKDSPPERPAQCYSNGGKINDTTDNPVIIATGSKVYSKTDFVSDDGLFVISRNYRSIPIGSSTSANYLPAGLTIGWQFNFGMELQLGDFSGSVSGTPTGRVTLLAPDGSGYDFNLRTTGLFTPRASSGQESFDYKVEFIGTLPTNLANVKTSSTQWRITGPDDRVWTLRTIAPRGSGGQYVVARPETVVTRDGYQWTFNYASDKSLTSIVDTFGRTATFTWNYFYRSWVSGVAPEPQAVDTITFPDGTSAKYTYDPAPATTPPSTGRVERLVSVALRDASAAVADSTTYHYENTDYRYALTGITDHRNVRIATYEYDNLGRAIRTEGADGENEITIAYGTSGSYLTRTVTNALGRETVYIFEKNGGSGLDPRLIKVDGLPTASCAGTFRTVSYDANGFIASTTDEEGRVTSYVRDSVGRPTQITTADGRPEEQVTTITWDTTYNVPLTIAAPGLTTTRAYNMSGQLTSLTQTDTTTHTVPYSTNGQTRVWAYTYTTGGLVATIDGPLTGTGDTVSYTYDAAGYVQTYTNELSHVTTVNAVNGRGQPTEIEDPNGLVTEIAYDAVGRPLTMTADPGGVDAETVIAYDDTGNVTRLTRPDGSYLDFEYDDNSRVESVANASGDKVEYSYDAMGNVLTSKFYNGTPTLFFQWDSTLDELGRLLSVTGVPTETWSMAYDKVDNLVRLTDPNQQRSSYEYDGLDRLVRFVDEQPATTTWTYGDTDAPESTTDPTTVVTGYVRSGWGEAIQEESNDVGTIVYELNKLGDVTERTDARSVVTEFSYDDAGRVTSVVYPGETSSNVAYTYDSVTGGNKGIGRLTGVTDAAGTVTYTYDILGRTIEEERVIGTETYTIGYGYDDAGNVVSTTYPSGRTVFFDRDANGDITAIRQQPSGGSVSDLVDWVGRTPFGPRFGVYLANGINESRTYDRASRITALDALNSLSTTYLLRKTYAYADKRNLTGIGDVLDADDDETYAYAPNGFLSIAHGPWTGLTAKEDVYSLESGSNRLAGVATDGTPSRSFDSDAAGNIVEDTNLSTSAAKEYAYNHPGQIAEAEVGGVTTGVYTYDYLFRLVSRELPSVPVTLHLVHDLDGNVIAEYDATGTLLTEYIWLDDRPVGMVADAGTLSPKVYWVHTDQLERPVMMTDDTAAVVWRASYLPFGEVASITGSATLDYRFPGQWLQLETGLAYNWHRHYDATTGRYLQPDPLGMPDGPSRWAYVANSPLMGVDPEGTYQLNPKLSPYSRGLEPGGGLRFGGGGGGGLPKLGRPGKPRRPPRPPSPPVGPVCSDGGDDPCEEREKQERRRCFFYHATTHAHPDYLSGCLDRALARKLYCQRNGIDDPGGPTEWNPDPDSGDAETWRNYGR